ncbi:MAG: DUF362 domain-containing protein [Christensenellales bacterium]
MPVAGGEYVKERASAAPSWMRTVHQPDPLQGHETTGFGGTIKNIGMGCGSRAGKTEQHSNGKPSINEDAVAGADAASAMRQWRAGV